MLDTPSKDLHIARIGGMLRSGGNKSREYLASTAAPNTLNIFITKIISGITTIRMDVNRFSLNDSVAEASRIRDKKPKLSADVALL